MPIAANPDGVLDIENATLRSREIATLSNFVAGNDEIRSSGAPVLEVYGDPANVGGFLPTLELVSNTESVTGTSFTRFTSNAGVFTIQSGTGGDADSKGDIAFSSIGGDTEHMRIQGSTGNVGIGTTDPKSLLNIQALSVNSGNSLGLVISDNQGGSSGTTLPAIGFAHNNGTIFRGGIQMVSESSNLEKGMIFRVGRDGSIGGFDAHPLANVPERMRINRNGYVGIGNNNPPQMLSVGGMTYSSVFASNYGDAYIENGYALLYILNTTQFWMWQSNNNGNNTYGVTYFKVKSGYPTQRWMFVGGTGDTGAAFEQGNYIKMNPGGATNITFRTLRFV